MLCPTLGSREATPSSDKESLSDVTAHCTKEGIKCSKKRHKQRLQGFLTMTDHNDSNDEEVGGLGMRCTSTATCSDKR
jgi:hypothetical protein